jgi:hypothetical protein
MTRRSQPRLSAQLALCLQRQATGRREAIAVLDAWVREATSLGAALGIGEAPFMKPRCRG